MNDLFVAALPYAFWGVVIHLFVDWMLQSEITAKEKTNLRNFAGYIHAGMHTSMLLIIFPWQFALFIGITHLLIDTRVPLIWWRRIYRQTTTGEMATHVAIWQDQVAHIVIICIVSQLLAFLMAHGWA